MNAKRSTKVSNPEVGKKIQIHGKKVSITSIAYNKKLEPAYLYFRNEEGETMYVMYNGQNIY